jgi:hypothetical protein
VVEVPPPSVEPPSTAVEAPPPRGDVPPPAVEAPRPVAEVVPPPDSTEYVVAPPATRRRLPNLAVVPPPSADPSQAPGQWGRFTDVQGVAVDRQGNIYMTEHLAERGGADSTTINDLTGTDVTCRG